MKYKSLILIVIITAIICFSLFLFKPKPIKKEAPSNTSLLHTLRSTVLIFGYVLKACLKLFHPFKKIRSVKHRLCGLCLILWHLYGILSFSNIIFQTPKSYFMYDIVLGFLGILTTISAAYDFNFGVHIKKNANKFLSEFGDPYHYSAADSKCKVSINFGVYGIPESILVNNYLKIIKKFIGPLNQDEYTSILNLTN